jgi:nucleotide-binding universal stress UspA family protein
MQTKTILTVLTDPALAERTLEQAETLAMGFDAHLDVLCLGVDSSQTGYDMVGAEVMVLQESLQRASDTARALAEQAETTLKRSAIRWAIEDGVSSLSDLGRSVALRARYSDLVAVPRPYGPSRGVELEPALEGALFEARTPVLVLPETAPVSARPRRVLLAWNESVEALTAARSAMSLLAAAESVHLAVIDPPQHGAERSDPGGLLAQYLARHGVRAEIDVLSKTMPRVSDVLQRHARDIDADLVVMGAYGHSRLREAVLGGATRDMLEGATLPVFMAH